MAAKFEAALKKSIDDGETAGVAAIAVDKTGKVIYTHAAGHRDIEKKANDFTVDTTTWFASMTKLLVAISCMQLVDRGLLSLDEPVTTYLPDFPSTTVLTGFTEDNTPITHPTPRPPTTRELLTHSSGVGYSAMNPLLSTYWTTHLNRAPDVTNNSIDYSHSLPLTFAPSTSWQYGAGIDWAGRIVEHLSGTRLEAYFQQNIFQALSLPPNLTTFHPTRSATIQSTFAVRPMRDPTTNKLTPDTTNTYPVIDPEDDMGGAGVYSSASQYIGVLSSLLLNDGKLLMASSRAELFRPSISPEAEQSLNEQLQGPFRAFLAPGYEASGTPAGSGGEEVRYSYAVGGAVIVNEGGIAGVADKGMLYWAGLPNCNWWVDTERGVAGVFVACLLPPGDAVTQGLYRKWREGVWELVGKA